MPLILHVVPLTLDVLSGRASRDYACGLKRGDDIATSETLSYMFGYFQSMRTCVAKLRYFDWDGQVHLANGKTGGDGKLQTSIFLEDTFQLSQNLKRQA